MRIALMTLCVLGAISALPAADPLQPPAPEVAPSKLWAAIAVNRPVIDPDTITQERFLMHFALVNDGDQTIETGANESQLIVNGKVVESREWLTAPAPAPVPIAGVGRVGSAPPPAPRKLM